MNFQGEAVVTVTSENGDETTYKKTNTVSNDLLKAIYRVMVAGEKYDFVDCPGGIGLDITDNGTHTTSTQGFDHGISGKDSMWLSSYAEYDIQPTGAGDSDDYMTFAFSTSSNQEVVTYTVDGIAGSELVNAGTTTINAIRLCGSPLNYPFNSDANSRQTILANITGLTISFASTDAIKIEYILKTPTGRGDQDIETLVSGWSQRFLKGMINTIARGATYQDELINGVNTTRESTNTLRICGAYLMETLNAQSSFSTNDTTELSNAGTSGTAFTRAIPNTMNEFNATTPTKAEANAGSMYTLSNAGNATLDGATVAYIGDADFKVGTISITPDTQTSASPFEVTLAQTWTSVANTVKPNAINIYARRYDETNNKFLPMNNVPPTDGATGGMDVVYRIIPDASSLTGWATGDNVTANLKFKVSALS